MTRNSLFDLLSYRRRAGSKSERAFIARFIAPTGARPDGFGNYVLRIGADDCPVMYSCHLDSVHRTGGRQEIYYQGESGTIGLITNQPELPNCLGADDAAGVWVMLQLIARKVSGLYVFHRQEESGGQGSAWISNQNPATLEGVKFCLALDRRGYDSVITHQGFGRCCSDSFAESLVDQLGAHWRLDDGGTFTDSANYVAQVPECTNLSVGYYCEHSPAETVNVWHLDDLVESLTYLEPDLLVCERDPMEDAWDEKEPVAWDWDQDPTIDPWKDREAFSRFMDSYND